jgi:hypothetical protein
LYMACTGCQNASIQTWQFWRFYCEAVYITQYPNIIPYTTAVPHWAYLNYTVRTSIRQAWNEPSHTSFSRLRWEVHLILCLRRPRAVQSHFHQSLRLCQLLCRQLTPTRSQPRGTTGERNHRMWVPSLEVLSVALRLWLRLAQPGCSSVNARQHTAMRIIQITPRFILAALPRPNMRTKYRLHNRGST